tara:strand:+ start:203 stop:556 length:354 start_codon:yes stop_codon:yes gene_type:complete
MAQYQEFTFDQGTDTTIELHLVDANGQAKNLLGYTVAGRIKKNYNSDSSDTTVFTTQITSNTEGTATLSLSNTQTDSMKAGKHVYDIELSHTDSGGSTIVERILEGRIQITPSVTKL